MTKSMKLLSSLFFATLFAATGCVTSTPKETSEDPDIYKVNEAEWNAAISFTNITHYRFRRVQNGTTDNVQVNAERKIIYSEQSEYCNTWYVREGGYTYMYDWIPSENIYYKYKVGEYNEYDGYALNLVPFYTKGFKYGDFTYQEDSKAYYQLLPEDTSVNATIFKRAYYYFKYQKLIKVEYFVWEDEPDGRDLYITVDYSNPEDINLHGIQYLDKGDINDNM